MEILTLSPTDPQWQAVVDFRENCHWIVEKINERKHIQQVLIAAIEDSNVLGFCGFTQASDASTDALALATLYIAETARGRGIAGQLMTQAQTYAGAHNITSVATPDAVKGIFEKYGFAVI